MRKVYNPLVTGNELKAERERLGLSQVAFAEMIGVYQPQLSRYEAAGNFPIPAQYATAERIRIALENRTAAQAGQRSRSR